MKDSFPEPDCSAGYSLDYLQEILDYETFERFNDWMYGQTMALCDGKRFNHETRQYEPDCETPHGGVAYSWDVKRFLGIIPGKEVWD